MVMPRSLRHESGFTLIELLVVVAIIGLLMSMTTMGIMRALEKAKITTAEGDLKHIADAIDAYRIEYDTAPPAKYDVLARQDLDADPTITRESPSEVIYLKRLALGNQLTTAFFDVWSDPEAPYVYIGVYSKNVDVVHEYLRTSNFITEKNFNQTDGMYLSLLEIVRNDLADQLRLTPSKLDLFVVMSAGPHDPDQNFGGLRADISDITFTDLPSKEQLQEIRMRRLTAYVLATIDKNDNGKRDYDYRSRNKKLDGFWPDGSVDYLPNGETWMGPLIRTGG